MTIDCDIIHMKHAMDLARRGLGITWPNPSVGCVIVKYGVVIGRGVTGRGGRPHAEVQAIKQAGVQTRGATLYVTLEPCQMCAGAMMRSLSQVSIAWLLLFVMLMQGCLEKALKF